MSKSGCSKVLAKEAKKYVVQKVLVYEPTKADQRWGPNTKMMPDRACQIEQMKRSCIPKLCDCPQVKGKASLILKEICFGAKIVAFLTLLKISIDAGIFGEQIETNRLVDSVRINAKKMAEEKEEKVKDEKEEKKDAKVKDEKESKQEKKGKDEKESKQEKKGKEEPKKSTSTDKQKEIKGKEQTMTTSDSGKEENKMKKEKEPKEVKNSENTEYESEWTLASVWNTLVVRIVKAILDFRAEDKVEPEKPPLKQ